MTSFSEHSVSQKLLDALRTSALESDLGDFGIVSRVKTRIKNNANRSFVPEIPVLIKTLNEQNQSLQSVVRFQNVGTVQHIGNGVATLSGLRNVGTDELVEFPTGVKGLVLNLEKDEVDVILLGPDEGIRGGDLVTASGTRLRVPVGPKLLGRTINSLGIPLDEKGALNPAAYNLLERNAPSIVDRTPVREPLQTGIKLIDALLPIGRGQRELIVGDRQTGKTSIVVDTIINQRDSEVDCVYVAIGQRKSSILEVTETLKKHDAMAYTTIVFSSPDDPPALRYIAPYVGCTIAEYLLHMGRDVLIIYDDLSKHADAYRELSLLLRRPPGREAYPGDIFYLHSRLLERACKLNEHNGGGSITALPIVEVQRGNISAYIPTNLISITDGQIILDRDMFNKGVKPAIEIGRSVSRVGGAAQTKVMRQVSGDLRLELAQFEEVERFSRFGTEVDPATQRQIERGIRLQKILTQGVHQPLTMSLQVILLYAALSGRVEKVELSQIEKYQIDLINYFEQMEPKIVADIHREAVLSEEIKEALETALDKFHQEWFEGQGES